MKKSNRLLFLFAAFLMMQVMLGCSFSNNDIVGVWKMYEGSDDGNSWRRFGSVDNIMVEIQKDGTFIQSEHNHSNSCKWSMNEDTLFLQNAQGENLSIIIVKNVTKEELVIYNGDEYIKLKRIQ